MKKTNGPNDGTRDNVVIKTTMRPKPSTDGNYPEPS